MPQKIAAGTHLARGTYGSSCKAPHRLSLRQSGLGLPEVPPNIELSQGARQWWDEVVPRLIEAGVATAIDSHSLVIVAELWSTIQQRLLDMPDMTPRQIKVLADLWRQQCAQFGLTPYARESITIKESPITDSEERYL